MPIAFRPGRLTVACLGLALGIGGPLNAGDIFCGDKCHHKDGGTRGVTRAATSNTIFLPRDATATPGMMGFCAMMPCQAPAGRDLSTNGLERALEAEHHAIMAESARAAFRAEVEGKQRLLQKLGALDTNGAGGKLTTELETRLKGLEDSLKTMSTRLTDVERLLIVHDNYLQQLSKNMPPHADLVVPGSIPAAGPGPMPMEPKKGPNQ